VESVSELFDFFFAQDACPEGKVGDVLIVLFAVFVCEDPEIILNIADFIARRSMDKLAVGINIAGVAARIDDNNAIPLIRFKSKSGVVALSDASFPVDENVAVVVVVGVTLQEAVIACRFA